MVFEIFGGLVGLIALICAIWVIFDVWANQRGMNVLAKVVWTVAALVFSIITAIIYYFVAKR